jgi:thiamine pyrophosphate-dependent acetolactate synthase large subunit-like protein
MFDWPDFAPVAEALGVRGVTVRNQGDLDAAVQAIAARDGPLLIDLRIDPERIAWG